MTVYFRPLAQCDPVRPPHALPLAGGASWWTQAEVLSRDGKSEVIPATEVPADVRQRLTARRAAVAGLAMDVPQVMGILNTTPDSFSDGGQHNVLDAAVAHARAMEAQGAALVDIGGESTRPGAAVVPVEDEIARVMPVVEALRQGGFETPISVDTRKAGVARAALTAGADLFNDVSALTFDPESADVAAATGAPVCLMHAQGDPATMQADPKYDNVLLDVYDFLAARIADTEAANISRDRILVDPGIGFGKTQAHNLALLRGLSLFHGLGCPILLGVSRKRFIGVIGNAQDAAQRAPGSIALGLDALRQGVQILRVHDVAETAQAIALWRAVH